MIEIVMLILASACAVCIVFASYWIRERHDVRREKRTGLTPPDGHGKAQGIIIPLDVVYAVQRDLSELVVGVERLGKKIEQVQEAQVIEAGRKILRRSNNDNEEGE